MTSEVSVREVIGGGYGEFWRSRQRYVVCKGSRASINRLGVEKFWKCTLNPLEMVYLSTGQKILFYGLMHRRGFRARGREFTRKIT